MPKNRERIYWDSCVFLAWLKNETREPGQMEGVEEVVKLVESNQVQILTSVISLIEVLESSLTDEGEQMFLDVFKRKNVLLIDVDVRIAKLARSIRNHYRQKPPTLKTPDAIHLATAIQYEADELQTFDGIGGDPGLISLSGNVAGHNLRVCAPQAKQLSLRLKPKTSITTQTSP